MKSEMPAATTSERPGVGGSTGENYSHSCLSPERKGKATMSSTVEIASRLHRNPHHQPS